MYFLNTIKILISSSNYIVIHLIILNSIVCILSLYKVSHEYLIYVYILQFVTNTIFMIDSLFLFYIFFELLLIPIYYTIYNYGRQQDKIYTSYKFIYYTLTGSLLWLSLLLLYCKYYYLDNIYYISSIITYLFLFALLVKLPLPPFHIWLNDTHTASPVSNSILLAGIILKLSTYGFITYYLTNYKINIYYIENILRSLLIYGAIYTSIACIRQIEYKRLIAYTSVGHMQLTILPLMTSSIISYNGSVLLLISHGFISSILFYHVNSIYERYHTIVIYYLRGLSIVMPISSTIALLLHIFNFSFPPAISWFSEYLIITSILLEYKLTSIIVLLTMIISLLYTIWNYYRIYLGKFNKYIYYTSDLSITSIGLQVHFIIFTLCSIILYTSVC